MTRSRSGTFREKSVLMQTSNVMAPTLLRLYRHFDSAEGDACQAAIDGYVAVVREFQTFAAIKATMARLSGEAIWHNARPPIVPLAAVDVAALNARLDAIGFAGRAAA